MIKKILPYTKKYGAYAILSPLTIIGEVWAEIQIPRLMSLIVDVGIQNRDISYVLKIGGQMAAGAVPQAPGLLLQEPGPVPHSFSGDAAHQRRQQRPERLYDDHPGSGPGALHAGLRHLYGV